MQSSKQQAKKHMMLAGIFALIIDGLDYLILPALPGYGDILDLVGAAIMYKLIGPLALIDLAELIPGEDFIPTFTISWIMAYLYKGKKK